jgi:hypothetical protein
MGLEEVGWSVAEFEGGEKSEVGSVLVKHQKSEGKEHSILFYLCVASFAECSLIYIPGPYFEKIGDFKITGYCSHILCPTVVQEQLFRRWKRVPVLDILLPSNKCK